MATTTWTLTAGGDFRTDLDWSDGQHPVAGDTADITNPFTAAYTVVVDDAEAAAQINLGAANATLAIQSGGVLTAAAIDVSAGTLALGGGGEITGDTTIAFTPGALFVPSGGTLDGVTWQGTLALAGSNNVVNVTTSLNVLDQAGTGPGEIDLTGSGAGMDIGSSMTLDGTNGNLPINIGNAGHKTNFLDAGSGDVLTLGSHVSVNLIGTVDLGNVSTGGTIINDGTMIPMGNFPAVTINPDTFINTGTMNLDEFAATIDITPLHGLTNTASGLISLGISESATLSCVSAPMDLEGTISISGFSKLDLNGNAIGSGDILMSSSCTVDIANYTGTITFLDATNELILRQPGSFTGTVVGLSEASGANDVIDLVNTAATGFAPYTGDTSGGTLVVLDNSATVATIDLIGNYINSSFTFAADANTGTDIFLACFVRGTKIATPSGEIAVEALREAQSVLTRDGGEAPIVWLGHRYIDCRRHPDPASVWPVRVSAGAFGPGLPRRDLFLSPDHAVFVDDVLIPIRQLINGDSIARETLDQVTYYHVELPRHDVLFAEGLPVESYLDIGDRANFANASGAINLFADFVRPGDIWEARGCAPLIVTGKRLEAVRRRIAPSSPLRRAVQP